MNTIKEIAEELKRAQTALIFPHINVDGDSLGSAVALTRALRKNGAKAYILIEDEIGDNLKFLDQGFCTKNSDILSNPELCICIDCGDENRMPKRFDKFKSGMKTMCIDHHGSTSEFTDFAYIDSKAAATGEIVFDILTEMEAEMDKEIGEALYAAISTDTGNFQYSNCTKRTHQIVAKLYDTGMNHNKVSIEIYENISQGKIKLDSLIMGTAEFFGQGKGAICYVTRKMLEETGTTMDETEGIVARLRSIKGVEIAAFLKEEEEEKIKVSMRVKSHGDVSKISQEFGGGGHVKAAGCTLYMTLDKAKELIMNRIEEQLK